jgi:hypothetical protein
VDWESRRTYSGNIEFFAFAANRFPYISCPVLADCADDLPGCYKAVKAKSGLSHAPCYGKICSHFRQNLRRLPSNPFFKFFYGRLWAISGKGLPQGANRGV